MNSAMDKYESMRSRKPQRDLEQKEASQFEQDFQLVAAHYELDSLGEYEQCLDTAKKDVVAAKICFAAMAADLRGEGLERGITERIQARIAQEQKAAA